MTPERFWDFVDQRGPDECWAWLAGSNPDGRGRVQFDGRMQYAYRVAVELSAGTPIANGMHACHSCDNPCCVNPSHIFIGTAKDNADDRDRKGRLVVGRRPKGEEHWASAATDDRVAKAKDLYASGQYSQREIGIALGVHQTTVSLWVRGLIRRAAA